ncbi:uncharacterized protein C3orf67 homolog [Lingula anatina]|uniref:Uncharacterized protein C3orf67 homolog n=1 Tax=Lingula anatina TaxID=7574 RepID=A0A1S3J3Q5_LINAN|nr:uncharacterized protein C3orf67 homolog [Lingula anatina]|eukprot:XP_013404893.1 uncharacterized protein C3orf67 homolog [Lingula anatina]
MFKNEFQGGPFFEVFSAQGKDPVANWKLSGGSGIRKVYDKEVKSYIYSLEGSGATTKMHIPKDSKQSLTLVQRFLVFQVWVPKGGDFSIEVGITDLSNSKRRLHLSTSSKEANPNPLHSKIPLSVIKRGIWTNLCLDMVSLVGETWRGQTYKAIESITLSANCRVRRIFTMKVQPADNTDDEELYGLSGTNSCEIDVIPKQCQLAGDVSHVTQVLSLTKIRQAEFVMRGGEGPRSRTTSATSDIDLNASGRKSAGDSFHIAFGSKVTAPAPGSAGRKGTAGKEGGATSRTSRSSHSRSKQQTGEAGDQGATKRVDKLVIHQQAGGSNHSRNPSDPGTHIQDPDTSVDKGNLGGSSTWAGKIDQNDEQPIKVPANPPGREQAGEMKFQPHPPREPSTERVRRKVRIKSGGKERTSAAHSGDTNQSNTLSPVPPGGNLSPINSQEGPKAKPRSPKIYTSLSPREVRGIEKEKSPSLKSTAVQSPREWIEEDIKLHESQSDMRKSRQLEKNKNKKETGVGPRLSDDYEDMSPRHQGELQDQDESLTDVIAALRGTELRNTRFNDVDNDNDEDDGIVAEYEDSDEEPVGPPQKVKTHHSRALKEDGVYLFTSPPKSAPSRSPTLEEESRVHKNDTRKSSAKRSLEGHYPTKRGAGPDDAFILDSSSDDDNDNKDEDHDIKRLGSPRDSEVVETSHENRTKLRSSKSRDFKTSKYKAKGDIIEETGYDDDDGVQRTVGSESEVVNLDRLSLEKSQIKTRNSTTNNIDEKIAQKSKPVPPPIGAGKTPRMTAPRIHSPRISNEEPRPSSSKRSQGSNSSNDSGQTLQASHNMDLLKTNGSSASGGSVSPRGSYSRCSISKKSLREISKDDARLSQNKQYDFTKYQMADLSESFEARMLASLKREAEEEMEEGGGQYEGGSQNSQQQKNSSNQGIDKHLYGDDDLSSSSDDTSFSTFRGTAPALQSHHYQDEMHLPTSRMSEDPLAMSNPRDWTGAFSPPIVLPSEMKHDPDPSELSPGKLEPRGSPRKGDKKSISRSPDGRRGRLPSKTDEDIGHEEDELDLLYDPCLNCYFDPKTCKYYELV